jgi:hypothetical protein
MQCALGRLEIHPTYSSENLQEKDKMGEVGLGGIIMLSCTLKK